MEQTGKPRIKVVKDGPYRVTGGVPISEKIIMPHGEGYVMQEGKELQQAEEYSLCRCGKSKNAPFCDGTHRAEHFDGTESASRQSYMQRARKLSGPDLDLYDDNRCAYARFCHREGGSVWSLTQRSNDPENKAEAIIAAQECPTGRLVAMEKNGTAHEIDCAPSIEVVQDSEENVSCGLFVKGGVELEAADGFLYERRMRYALCRCGRSRTKPMCDAMHVPAGWKDK
ncbi:MAG TPA: CDGSH iron-sulfur domain-containing protein [Clostridia bacterium]|nr:CDGSH iron-sulfur domain-containing protein [Clostridia bacterium]